jgi:twitching motility protein PilJ
MERAALLTQQYTDALYRASDLDLNVKLGIYDRILDVEIALVLAHYYLNSELLNPEEIQIAPLAWIALTEDLPQRLTAFGNFAFGFLENVLQEREAALAHKFRLEAGVVGAVALLVLAVLVILGRTHRENKLRRQEAEQQNSKNQASILQLMDELGNISQGDLKARASVTEEITGAIADSINLTVSELHKVVQAIHSASDKVNVTTKQAQSVSSRLNAATQIQSKKIQDASEQIEVLNLSANEVSANSAETSTAARQALSAAEKGASAVGDTVKGMNEIREQIQDTSKRIKRLGESSQEIGEIVNMISELTQQTNVLALNAAIQAAAAGEAGRGFTVVAEEVQRLAERSAVATKRIGGIVKTIQTDTQDTVAAMERCTHGVVQGNALSEAAGRALNEIRSVSKALAERIDGISTATEVQKDVTRQVQNIMKAILTITQQTTEGTKLTANSIVQLSQLTSGLRTSVASFKV